MRWGRRFEVRCRWERLRLGWRRERRARHRRRRHTQWTSDETGSAGSWWRRTCGGWRRASGGRRRRGAVQQRASRILNALVEDLRGLVLVVPVDIHAGLPAGLGRSRWRRRRRSHRCAWRLELGQRRGFVFAARSRERRGRRGRRRGRGSARHGGRLGGTAHAGWWRRRRKPARLSLERRRRRRRRHTAARHRRGRRLARRGGWRWHARLGRRGQPEQRLLTRGRRWGNGATAAGQGGRSRSAWSRLLRRQSVKHVEVRTRLVAHRCCSLCFFSLTLLWRPVLETPVGGASLAHAANRDGPRSEFRLQRARREISSRKDTSPTWGWREVLLEFGPRNQADFGTPARIGCHWLVCLRSQT